MHQGQKSFRRRIKEINDMLTGRQSAQHMVFERFVKKYHHQPVHWQRETKDRLLHGKNPLE